MSATAASTEIDARLRARLVAHIRDVPDFPAPGVLFKDITPLLADARAFRDCVDALAAPWRSDKIDAVTRAARLLYAFASTTRSRIGSSELSPPG